MKKLTTKRLILRPPQLQDLIGLKAFEKRNKTHLDPWGKAVGPAANRLASSIQDMAEGRSIRFFLFSKEDPQTMIGMCNFTQIFRGVFQACSLGYKIDKDYEGQGLMFEALQCTIRYIFEGAGLHRIEANYMPRNSRSANTLENLGFAIEGYAKNYLLINDKWEDHILTALSHERWSKLNQPKKRGNISI